MNLVKILFLLIFMISSNLIFGQNSTDYYSKTEIAKIIKLKYGFDLEKDNYEVLYIIDKIPYSESDLEKELKKFNKSDIKTIYGFEQEVTKYSASSNNFITILSTQSQERKYKRKKLKELITLFKNSNEIPLLSIDNALIEYSSDYIEILENLKINEIDHIVYITQPLNKDTYPNKGENGIVEILLR